MPIASQLKSYQKMGSLIRKLFEEGSKLANDGSNKPVFDFTIGNPELEPPKMFDQTLLSIVGNKEDGTHRYMPNQGYLNTRKAVAQSLKKDHGLDFCAENIIMTVGAAGAVNICLKALLDPGDEVIVNAPYFVEYQFYTENHGGKMVVAQTGPNFNLDIEQINSKLTDKTRAVIITNPNNPTGVLYPQETLNALGNLLRKASKGRNRPIFLIDDAPYRKLVFDLPKCTSAFKAYENTLMATSFSKDLGIPGERIGFLAISPDMPGCDSVAAAATFANRTLGFVNAPGIMQRVVENLQDVTIDLNWYKKRRDLFCSGLTQMGYELVKPGGAFYIFPKAPGGDDFTFVEALKDQRVLAVPGTAFGKPGYFRLAYCVSEQKIANALPHFETAKKKITEG